MNLNDLTSLALKIFLYLGVIIMAIGLIFSDQELGNDILWLGVLVLLIVPIAGLIAPYLSLIREKDWYWVKITSVVIVMIVIGILISIFF